MGPKKHISVSLPGIYVNAIEIVIKAGLFPNRTAFMNDALAEFLPVDILLRESLVDDELSETFNIILNEGGN